MHPNLFTNGNGVIPPEEPMPMRAIVGLILIWGSLFAAGLFLLP